MNVFGQLATSLLLMVTLSSQALSQQSTQGNAVLEGTLSYPSDDIPKGIQVCAVDVAGGVELCTTNGMIKRTRTETTFQLSVPAGVYHVFARLTDPSTFSDSLGPDYRAYYSEFVRCGSNASCPSHAPVAVEARQGKRTKVDPSDWYGGAQNNVVQPAATANGVATVRTAENSSAADALGSGTYRGTASNERLTLAIKGSRAVAQLIGNMCVGEIEGSISNAGKSGWKLQGQDGCSLTIRADGQGYTVKENGCTGFHGPSCSFDGYVSK